MGGRECTSCWKRCDYWRPTTSRHSTTCFASTTWSTCSSRIGTLQLCYVLRLPTRHLLSWGTHNQAPLCNRMLRVHRWMLLDFKREFPLTDALAIWETVWCGHRIDGSHHKHSGVFLSAWWNDGCGGGARRSTRTLVLDSGMLPADFCATLYQLIRL
jgi:hypothetical protein